MFYVSDFHLQMSFLHHLSPQYGVELFFTVTSNKYYVEVLEFLFPPELDNT